MLSVGQVLEKMYRAIHQVEIHSLDIFIYLDFHSTKQALWLVDSWSHTPDQIKMYPNWDTIA